MTPEEIDNRFTYHRPHGEVVEMHEGARSQTRKLAEYMNEVLPEGREKSLVITKLEEALFWANAAIARTPSNQVSSSPATFHNRETR
jgi:hypothetical protein